GLSNDQIKQYVLKCSSDFGGSKSKTELACQLFLQKFKNGHLVYNKLNYSYTFDFGTCISEIDIDRLRSWPSNDEIDDAIRIAYENANAFINLLHMRKKSKISYAMADYLMHETNNQSENKEVFQTLTIDQIAKKLNRVSQLEDILDKHFVNTDISEDLNSELDQEFEPEDLLEITISGVKSFINKSEINYIISNSQLNILQKLNYEHEEKIFRNDRSSFSRSDHLYRTQAIELNQESSNGINQNLSLINDSQTKSCVNISETHPLEKNGYLLVWTNGMLYIAKVLAMYQLIGEKHSFVSKSIDNLDSLSYISVSLFINIYGDTLFSNECKTGGKLYTYLKPKEVVYYFGTGTSFTFHSNSLLILDQKSLEIYLFFRTDNTRSHLVSIFDNKNTN
ncbi:16749_t:CDS:2, partial [Cetraspora pellucida]